MNLRCKPGDVARVVSSSPQTPENVGRYVCVKLALGEVGNDRYIENCPDGFTWSATAPGMQWWCEGAIAAVWEPTGEKKIQQAGMFADCELRPIRDSDAPDEMIELVGKPETVSA